MALTITETKKRVTRVMPGQWNITRNLVFKEDGVEVLTKDFTLSYKTGDDITLLAVKFLKVEQEAIDIYEGEQAILKNPKMDQMTTYLNANLVV